MVDPPTGPETDGREPLTVEEAVAVRLAGASARETGPAGRWLHELAQIDRAVYGAIARQESPALDAPLRRLSILADGSAIWFAIAGTMALLGGRRGRRAGLTGSVAIGVTSAFVNLGVKALYPRTRPDREEHAVPVERHVRMPTSTSFPSGHSASGFAFATAVGFELPLLGAPLRALAATVAYSRVHTGVHYPGDAVAGALIGGITGQLVARTLLGRRTRPCATVAS